MNELNKSENHTELMNEWIDYIAMIKISIIQRTNQLKEMYVWNKW